MSKAILDHNGIASQEGEITVYNYDKLNNEYLSRADEWLALGIGIPADACTDAPPAEKAGFARCRNADHRGWHYVADHRGETVYQIATGKPIILQQLGDYPSDVTPLAPQTPYDHWNGHAWITDKTEQQNALIAEAEQKKRVLLADAHHKVSLWQTELQLDMISDQDKKSLVIGITYIQQLRDLDCSTAPDIDWPAIPA